MVVVKMRNVITYILKSIVQEETKGSKAQMLQYDMAYNIDLTTRIRRCKRYRSATPDQNKDARIENTVTTFINPYFSSGICQLFSKYFA